MICFGRPGRSRLILKSSLLEPCFKGAAACRSTRICLAFPMGSRVGGVVGWCSQSRDSAVAGPPLHPDAVRPASYIARAALASPHGPADRFPAFSAHP